MIGKRKKADGKGLEELCSKRLSLVVERTGGEEKTLGRSGGASVVGGELVIVCDGREVFRCDISGCTAAPLMSGNGCDIKGVHGGQNRHVVAYYSRSR